MRRTGAAPALPGKGEGEGVRSEVRSRAGRHTMQHRRAAGLAWLGEDEEGRRDSQFQRRGGHDVPPEQSREGRRTRWGETAMAWIWKRGARRRPFDCKEDHLLIES